MADWPSAFTYAARRLRRQPTFLAVSLLTLALGIGANTAIFSVIKAVVLNPLPYAEPERIVVLWEVNPEGNQDRVSVPDLPGLEKRSADAGVDCRVPAGGLHLRGIGRADETCRECARRPACSRS